MATIYDYGNFHEDEDAQQLKDAMDGMGTNEEVIIQILAGRSNQQRRIIKDTYKTMFGEDLIEDLKSELGGNFETIILALLDEPIEYQAKELHHAISGMGTDDLTLLEILAVHNNEEVQQISNKYQELYENSLEDDIKGDESGALQRLLVSLSTGNRDDSKVVDRNAAIADAQELYDAGENAWGTEESTFNAILCLRSRPQLNLVFQEYETMIGHPIEEAIDNEFSGTTRDCLLGLIMCMRDRPMYLATRLHDAMDGMGTDDRTLIRIIVSRSEIDLQDIKNSYEAQYNKSLSDRVADDVSSDCKNILVALIVGNF